MPVAVLPLKIEIFDTSVTKLPALITKLSDNFSKLSNTCQCGKSTFLLDVAIGWSEAGFVGGKNVQFTQVTREGGRGDG
jgi:hypothetical protein